MRDNKLLTKPRTLEEFRFEDLYIEISDHWEQKAKRLQARRWRRLNEKRQPKRTHHMPNLRWY